MRLSLPANPVPAELYQFYRGSAPVWLPWYVWGGGVFATKYDYDTTKYIGYLGTVSVPLSGKSVTVKSLRLTGAVSGEASGSTEGALILAHLLISAPAMFLPRSRPSGGSPHCPQRQPGQHVYRHYSVRRRIRGLRVRQ